MATLGLALLVMVLVALPNLRADTRIPLTHDERAQIRARRRNRYHPKFVARRTWQAAVRFQRRAVRVWAGVVRAGRAVVRAAHALVPAWHATVRAGRGVVRAGQNLAPAGQAVLRGSTALHQRISAAWAPVSTLLHDAMDRLEGHQPASHELSRQTESASPPADIVIQPAADPVSSTAVAPAVPAAPATAPVKRGPVRDRFDVAAVTAGRPVGRPRSFPAISGPIPEIREAAHPEPTVEPAVDGATVIDLRRDGDAEQSGEHEQSAGSIQNAR